MEIQSVYQQRAEREGWRVVTPDEWYEIFGYLISEKGTAFRKAETKKAFATTEVGEAAWADLCDIASIK